MKIAGFKALGIQVFALLIFIVTPVTSARLTGCVDTKKAVFVFNWYCGDQWFRLLTLSLIIGASLILLINVFSKKHSIGWYLIGSGTLFLVSTYWFILWILSQASVPIA